MRYMYILPFWVIPHLRCIQAMKLISRKSETEEETCCEQCGRLETKHYKEEEHLILCTGTKQ